MSLNIVDVFIVLFVIMGGVIGAKNGAIQEIISFVGIIVIVFISFLFKDQLMVALYENLPFFELFGIFKGITAFNILLYQLIAFLVIFCALTFLLRVLIVITGLVEWLLKLTVFLKIPSKILGVVVGALKYYVYAFLILYVLNMPVFNLEEIQESKFGNTILENTPILSGFIDNTVDVYSDVWKILKNKDDKTNTEINTLVLESLLDNNLITVDSAKKLVESNKVTVTDTEFLDEY